MLNDITINQLSHLKQKYDRLTELLTYEEVLLDKKLFLNFEKQQLSLAPVVNKYNEFLGLTEHLQELNEILKQVSNEEMQMFLEEKTRVEKQLSAIELQLINELNKYNAVMQSCIVEFVPNKDDISIKLLNIILGAYSKFCEINNFEYQIVNSTRLKVSGLNAKNIFNDVKGVHSGKLDLGEGKLQVFVFDAPEEKTFSEKDVVLSACRSSGAGGQHVNTTDSAIKATHTPSGISCTCQDERSQFQNKQKALQNLKQKVENYYSEQLNKAFDLERKKQLKDMKLNSNVRFYNVKEAVIECDDMTYQFSDFLQGKFI